MMRSLAASRRMCTRYSVKVEPIERTCFSKLDELKALSAKIIGAFFDKLTSPTTYAVELIRRGHNSQLERDTVVHMIAALVPRGRGHTVDLKKPRVTILVQIATRLAGIAVIDEYAAMHKFNIRAIGEGRQTLTETTTPPLQTLPSTSLSHDDPPIIIHNTAYLSVVNEEDKDDPSTKKQKLEES